MCLLQNDAAVFRTQESLEHGCKQMDECVESFAQVGTKDRSMVWNTDLMETLELENLLINAAVTVHSAEARKVCSSFAICNVVCYVVGMQHGPYTVQQTIFWSVMLQRRA